MRLWRAVAPACGLRWCQHNIPVSQHAVDPVAYTPGVLWAELAELSSSSPFVYRNFFISKIMYFISNKIPNKTTIFLLRLPYPRTADTKRDKPIVAHCSVPLHISCSLCPASARTGTMTRSTSLHQRFARSAIHILPQYTVSSTILIRPLALLTQGY